MAITEVVRVLQELDDEVLRLAVADDADTLAGRDLTDHERFLLMQAARRYPRHGEESTAALEAVMEVVRYIESASLEPTRLAELEEPEVRFARSAEEAVGVPSFAEFADASLYGEAGYYAGGVVQFGVGGDFWTYPQRMSPLFGWMVAELIGHLLDDVVRCTDPGDDDPMHILELGGGEGRLAADILDRLADMPRHMRRLRYFLGDRSPAMRTRQTEVLSRHVESGIVEVVDIDAVYFDWEGTFRGVILANELLDALAHERLRFCRDSTDPGRVHVLHQARGPGTHVVELEVPLSTGWATADSVIDPPEELASYVERLRPIVEEIREEGLEPEEVFWSAEVASVIGCIADVLTAEGNIGAAVLIDYGDTTAACLDTDDRMRVYGSGQLERHAVYTWPGQVDMTWDVDFSEVARTARAKGLEVAFYGDQAGLEMPPIDLDDPIWLEALVAGRVTEGTSARAGSIAAAHVLAEQFRSTESGFRVMVLATPGLVLDELPLSHPLPL